MSSKAQTKLRKKTRNWSEYNKNLQKRGSISLFIDEAVLADWRALSVRKRVFSQRFYSDLIIESCLLVQHHLSLTLRQTRGFLTKMLGLLGIEEAVVPCYTTISRRSKTLKPDLKVSDSSSKSLSIAIDSTGLKRRRIGEWLFKKYQQQGENKQRRRWEKLHLIIDLDTIEILCFSLTENDIADSEEGEVLVDQIGVKIDSCYSDGAYDVNRFRLCLGQEVKQIIPPRKDAVALRSSDPKFNPLLLQRNQAVWRIKQVGRSQWKGEVAYHRRNLVETTMYRFKVTFGDELKARTIQNQNTETAIKCKILNIYAVLGFG